MAEIQSRNGVLPSYESALVKFNCTPSNCNPNNRAERLRVAHRLDRQVSHPRVPSVNSTGELKTVLNQGSRRINECISVLKRSNINGQAILLTFLEDIQEQLDPRLEGYIEKRVTHLKQGNAMSYVFHSRLKDHEQKILRYALGEVSESSARTSALIRRDSQGVSRYCLDLVKFMESLIRDWNDLRQSGRYAVTDQAVKDIIKKACTDSIAIQRISTGNHPVAVDKAVKKDLGQIRGVLTHYAQTKSGKQTLSSKVEYLKDMSSLGTTQASLVAIRLASTLQDIHDKNYVVRNINPETIIVGRRNDLSTVAFGQMTKAVRADEYDRELRHERKHLTYQMGAYGAPELVCIARLEHGSASKKADIYSLGVVICGALGIEIPKSTGLSKAQAIATNKKIQREIARLEQISPDQKEVLLAMTGHPNLRPSLRQVEQAFRGETLNPPLRAHERPVTRPQRPTVHNQPLVQIQVDTQRVVNPDVAGVVQLPRVMLDVSHTPPSIPPPSPPIDFQQIHNQGRQTNRTRQERQRDISHHVDQMRERMRVHESQRAQESYQDTGGATLPRVMLDVSHAPPSTPPPPPPIDYPRIQNQGRQTNRTGQESHQNMGIPTLQQEILMAQLRPAQNRVQTSRDQAEEGQGDQFDIAQQAMKIANGINTTDRSDRLRELENNRLKRQQNRVNSQPPKILPKPTRKNGQVTYQREISRAQLHPSPMQQRLIVEQALKRGEELRVCHMQAREYDESRGFRNENVFEQVTAI